MIDLLSIVVNYRTPQLRDNFIDSYMNYVHTDNRRLVVVDVGVTDDLIPLSVRTNPVGYFRTEDNIGYAKAINKIARQYDDKDQFPHFALGIFNADTEFIDSECVDSCLALLDQNEDVGIVGPLQTNSKNEVVHSGILGTNKEPRERAWRSKRVDNYRDVQEAIYVSGSAMFVKRKVWDEMAIHRSYRIIDPESEGAFLTTDLYYEDTWLCYHARSIGYKTLYNGEAEMLHHHNSSPNSPLKGSIKTSRKRFREACDALGIEHG